MTGNTVIDALLWIREKVRQTRPDLPDGLAEALDGRQVVLVTGHRRESFGEGFQNVCHAIRQIADTFQDVVFVSPVHPAHKRILHYAEDTCRTFANIVENFIPGEVYNVGGKEERSISIEELSDVVLQATGADPRLAICKARKDLPHEPRSLTFQVAPRSKTRPHG